MSSILTTRDLEGDDDFYMDKMKEILEGFPNTGPPAYPAKLLDWLFMGNQDNAEDYDLLPALGITYVLNCAGTRTFDLTRHRYPPKIGIEGFLMLPAEDYDEFHIMQFFPDAIAFLDKAKASGGKALIHCNLGVNRSGAIAAAYLMVCQRKPLLKVVSDLKAKRGVVLCNVGFRQQLMKYARCRGLLDAVDPPPRLAKLREDCSGASNGQQIVPRHVENEIPYANGKEGIKKEVVEKAYTTNGNGNSNSEEHAYRSEVTEEDSEDENKTKNMSSETYLTVNGERDDWRNVKPDDQSRSASRSVSPYRSKNTTYSPASSSRPARASANYYEPDLNIDTSAALESLRLSKQALLKSSSDYSPSFSSSLSGNLADRLDFTHVASVPLKFEISDPPLTKTGLSSFIPDISPAYLSSSLVLGSGVSFADDSFSHIKTPITDSYKYTSRDSTGSSYADSAALLDAEIGLLGKSLLLSPSVDSTFAERPSVHPLLATPYRAPSVTSTSDNFKTTVKPKSYYYRKVAGRVPKYDDYEDVGGADLLSSLYSNQYGGPDTSVADSSFDFDTSRRYSTAGNTAYNRTGNTAYSTTGNAAYNQTYLNGTRAYMNGSQYGGDYSSTGLSSPAMSNYKSSSSYNSYSKSPLVHTRSRSVDPSGYRSSYRPSYTRKSSTYSADLDEDIEAYRSASFGSYPTTPTTMRTRVVPPVSSGVGAFSDYYWYD